MSEINPLQTYAILIGIPNYKDGAEENDLPSTLDNIIDFRQVLGNSLSISANRIELFPGGNKTDVLSHIGNIVRKPDCKNIIIYYAGHGIPGNDNRTYLSFSDMRIDDYRFKGLRISEITEVISDEAPNTNLILFLDCCFSEASLEGINLTNFFALAAASSDETANYPVGAEFSSFYQAVKNIQTHGIDNNSKTITFGDLYIELKSVLNNQKTHRAQKNDLDQVVFCKNNYDAKTIPVSEEIKPAMDFIFRVISQYEFASREDIAKVTSLKNSEQQRYYGKIRALIFKYLPYPLGLLLKEYTITSNPIDKATKIKEFLDTSIKYMAIILLSQLQRDCEDGKHRDKYEEVVSKMTLFPAHDANYYLDLIKELESFFQGDDTKILPFFGAFLGGDLDGHFRGISQLLSISLANFSEENALQFETILWDYLKLLSRLVGYTLVAVSSVGLTFKSFDEKYYTHYGSTFEGDSANNYDSLFGFIDLINPINTHSVFLVKDIKSENKEYINLWPFVVDVKCFDKSGDNPDIYFMVKKVPGNAGYYTYQSVERSKKDILKVYTEIDLATETVDRQFKKFKTIWRA